MMQWKELSDAQQLEEIDALSKSEKVLIFKHSTRCNISSAALNRLERKWTESDQTKVKTFFLDLIRYRELSSRIAGRYSIHHESPQVLLIENGACSYARSHFEIIYEELIKEVNSN